MRNVNTCSVFCKQYLKLWHKLIKWELLIQGGNWPYLHDNQYVNVSSQVKAIDLVHILTFNFVFHFQISYVLVQFDYFVCPITYDDASDNLSMDCVRHPVFILTEFSLPLVIQKIFSIVSIFSSLDCLNQLIFYSYCIIILYINYQYA